MESMTELLEAVLAPFVAACQAAFDGDPRGIVALVFAAVGVACLHSLVYQLRIDRWPTVRGRVRDAGVTAAGGGSTGPTQMYVETLEYDYRVDGVDHVGTRLSPWVVSASHNARGFLAWRMRGLEPGATVEVVYNPRQPTASFLRRSGPVGKAVTILMAGVMLAVPSLLY